MERTPPSLRSILIVALCEGDRITFEFDAAGEYPALVLVTTHRTQAGGTSRTRELFSQLSDLLAKVAQQTADFVSRRNGRTRAAGAGQ